MEDLALVATVPVAKKKALFKSGPKKNKLRPGCRFKGKRVLCTPEVAARLNASSGGGRKKRGGGMRAPIVPKSPRAARNMSMFDALMLSRANYKAAREAGNCGAMRQFAQSIVQSLQYMGSLPAKPSKRNPNADPRVRNRPYISEMDRIKAEVMTSCSVGGGGGNPAYASPANPTMSREEAVARIAANRARYEYKKSQAYEDAEMNRFSGLGRGKNRKGR